MSSSTEQRAEGNWKKFKGRLQEAWGALTNDELDRYKGKRERLEGHIQEKTGAERRSIRKKLNKIAREEKYKF